MEREREKKKCNKQTSGQHLNGKDLINNIRLLLNRFFSLLNIYWFFSAPINDIYLAVILCEKKRMQIKSPKGQILIQFFFTLLFSLSSR